MSALFSLLIFASESRGKGPSVAPEVLDALRLQEWLAGSVWALIGLNLIALALFLTALVAPQIKSLKEDLASKWKALLDWRAANLQARLEAKKLAEAKRAEEKAKREAEEAARIAEDKARKISEDGLPSIAATDSLPLPPPPPPPVVAAPVAAVVPPAPIAPPPQVEAPELGFVAAVLASDTASKQREPFGVDEKTEILDSSQIDALLGEANLEAPKPAPAPAPTPAAAPVPPPVAAAVPAQSPANQPTTSKSGEFSWGSFESSLGNLDKIFAEAEAYNNDDTPSNPDKTEVMHKTPPFAYSQVDQEAAASYLASIKFSWDGFEKSLDQTAAVYDEAVASNERRTPRSSEVSDKT